MDLATTQRPTDFDSVWGQDALCKALKGAIAGGTTKTFLFHGPSGCGKTTLARIVASQLGCTNLIEIDAASNTGIEDMRQVTAAARFSSMGGGKKMVIIDEAHGLSAKAWDSMLKAIEEPPPHLYWSFCTTLLSKVPTTIRTRCMECPVKPVGVDDLTELVDAVVEEQGIEIPEGVSALIARRAAGSPRMALKMLGVSIGADSLEEVRGLIGGVASESQEVVALCRYLFKPTKGLAGAIELLHKIDEDNAESVRQVMIGYYWKVLAGAKGPQQMNLALAVLACFANPYPPAHNLYPVALSLADFFAE